MSTAITFTKLTLEEDVEIRRVDSSTVHRLIECPNKYCKERDKLSFEKVNISNGGGGKKLVAAECTVCGSVWFLAEWRLKNGCKPKPQEERN